MYERYVGVCRGLESHIRGCWAPGAPDGRKFHTNKYVRNDRATLLTLRHTDARFFFSFFFRLFSQLRSPQLTYFVFNYRMKLSDRRTGEHF